MNNTGPTEAEAYAALQQIQRSRQAVINEIDMPTWYWWGLALGWMALGVLTDLGHPWLTLGATFVFGAVHSSVSQLTIGGRHRTSELSVRRDVAGRRTPLIVIGSLLGLATLTIAGALAARADHAHHPVTVASVFVAVLILLGGPQMMAIVRHRATRASAVTFAP